MTDYYEENLLKLAQLSTFISTYLNKPNPDQRLQVWLEENLPDNPEDHWVLLFASQNPEVIDAPARWYLHEQMLRAAVLGFMYDSDTLPSDDAISKIFKITQVEARERLIERIEKSPVDRNDVAALASLASWHTMKYECIESEEEEALLMRRKEVLEDLWLKSFKTAFNTKKGKRK